MNLYQPTISGSLTVSGSVIVDGTIIMTSGSISGTASLAENSLLLNNLNSGSFAGTGSFSNVSSSFAATSGSLSTRVTNLEATSSVLTAASASFATTSGSLSSRVTIIEGQDATTGSNNFTGVQYVSEASNAISFTSTASLYTDGGLRVAKDSFVSGTAYFNNITVYGTSSIQYITSSQVNIGSNIITVNTDTPAVRFGGLSVFDSGSTQLTGSLFWDSEKNHWIYSNPSGSSYNSGMIMSGPRNSGSLGDEQGTTLNALMKGQGGDHITSSQMFDDGTTVRIPGALQVTGSTILSSTAVTGSVNITGSFIVTTTAPELQVGATGVTLGNIITDNHNVTGSLRVSGSFGLNKAVPQRQYTQVANTNGIVFTIQNANASNEGYIVGFDSTGSTYLQLSDSTNTARVYLNSSGSSYINSGNVGIGTSNPSTLLQITTPRANGANVNVLTLSDNVTGAQTAGFGTRIQYLSNGTGVQAAIGLENGGTGTNNESQISFYTQNSAGTLAQRLLIASTGAATFSSSVTANGVMSLGNDSTYGSTYKTLGLTGNSNGSHRIFAGTADNLYIAAATARGIEFWTDGSSATRMIITSAGAVGIGTSNPGSYTLNISTANTPGILLNGTSTGGNWMAYATNGTIYGYISSAYHVFSGGAAADFGIRSEANLVFGTSSTERMRITTTTPNNTTCVLINKTSAAGSYPLQVAGGNGAYMATASGGGDANYYSTSNTIGYHFYADRGASGVFWVATNGDVRNANNSYGGTSDIKLKENITDASPKLEDLLKVKIRNYNFISDETKTKQIGVIAQELEEIFPNMISEDKQMNSNETIKTVKYSVFVPMLIKAIQELKAEFDEYKTTHP